MECTARTIAWIALSSLAVLAADRAGAQDWAREMFDHTSHDFGTVARGAKVEHRFGVENIYLEDAHIKSARASCGCTSPEVPVQILKTRKKFYVLVKVDTVNFQGQKDVTSHALAARFRISRQQAHLLLQSLTEKGFLEKHGKTKGSYYTLK